ncbi:copper chaperone PCu(A)C [Methylobacterium radiotolerans]|uniref:YncI copper-binding domain-containing protein n=1 Tax=Methylobacterium radiotolerans (strain ATCC 27329 / DSM 1819 / JCM 2831 / NBRC 15690 / NCIMB 10815 / 0-1) TaxID=426355 RepID=B1M921_METRJ|nr:DUF1775 domain-containing protein [Methylobacterium radiotolerans]ACB27996.1 protein of unknown function DUF461 [Methylobacterium radiotolerans JCM 2831]KTS08499.1 copper chaperone [Methylobacterium radiotolerans]GEN01358.1 hypothetical protein MRA01_58970 [Methylobacterium radiotolerans]
MHLATRLVLVGLVAIPSTSAWAHAVLERKEASPDASYRGVVQITHGCAGSPTTRVSVTIPEGVVGAKPMPKPGWQVTTTKGAYAKAYPYYHGLISGGVKTITWTGSSLPDDQVDEFTFFSRISDAFVPGQTVYFPVQQDCEKGSYSWSEIPAPGTSVHALKEPAPGVRIVAAQSVASVPTHTYTVGDLRISHPWSRATPASAKVAGGYLSITNTGTEPDRLTAAALDGASRGEVHSMSMEGGVMKMAPVEGGLEIKPGETVTLKPGGYHLMFLDMKAPLKKGEPVKGTLTFERAGTVAVEFDVEGIGTQAPAGEGHVH